MTSFGKGRRNIVISCALFPARQCFRAECATTGRPERNSIGLSLTLTFLQSGYLGQGSSTFMEAGAQIGKYFYPSSWVNLCQNVELPGLPPTEISTRI